MLPPPPPPAAIHGKNLVAILHLLVSLAMHFRAPIHLPEHVTVQVVVVRVSTQGHCLSVHLCWRGKPTFSSCSFPAFFFSRPPASQEPTFYFSLLIKCISHPGASRNDWSRDNGVDFESGTRALRFNFPDFWRERSFLPKATESEFNPLERAYYSLEEAVTGRMK